MKQITTVILLINGLLITSAVQGQNRQNGSKNREFGAPNSVRNQSQSKGQENRQKARQPLGSANQTNKKGKKSQQKPQGPKTGMTKVQKGHHIVKVLELNEEQAQQLKAAHQEMGATAKGIRGNNELSEEEKKAALREAHMEQRENLAGFLSEEQLAKLEKIHRQNAKPKPNQNKPKPGANIAKALGLSKKQEAKLRKAREFTAKKVGSIVKNKELSKEEQRGVSEQLTGEQLALFDILTKPEIVMTAKEKDEVKKVARMLLQTLTEAKLVLDWRKKRRTRADVYTTVLDEFPCAYTSELYLQKCDTVYQHVYDSYQGEGRSIYVVV